MAQYDKIAGEYEKVTGAISTTKEYIQVPMLVNSIGNTEGKKVLDLACGSGFFTRILARQNPRKIVGVDESEGQIDLAREYEKREPLGIEYNVKDAKELELNKRFDRIVSVFLLNYAKTRKELETMAGVIHKHLDLNGRCFSIVPHPDRKPYYEFRYGVKVYPADGKGFFEDGDPTVCEFYGGGMEKPLGILQYYWSKEAYDSCLRKAGFKSIRWIEPTVSKEGIKRFGEEYWKAFRENPLIAGIACN